MQEKQKNNTVNSFLTDFILGGIAGTISKTTCAPIERVKIVLQVQKSIKFSQGINENPQKLSISGCIKQIYQKDGVSGFWKGNNANIIRYFPTTAINFSVKDYLNQVFLKGVDSQKEKYKFMLCNVLSGGFAGATSMLIVYPLDLARTRLGADLKNSQGKPQFTGIYDCLNKIYKVDGIRGLYNGLQISMYGIFVYRGLQFGIYDTGKQMIQQDKELKEYNDSLFFKFLFAQSVVVVSETISFPLDTIKRRLMMQSGKGKQMEAEFKGTWDCVRKIAKNEGYQGFFSGVVTNIYRSVGSSLVLVLYDKFKYQLFQKLY